MGGPACRDRGGGVVMWVGLPVGIGGEGYHVGGPACRHGGAWGSHVNGPVCWGGGGGGAALQCIQSYTQES